MSARRAPRHRRTLGAEPCRHQTSRMDECCASQHAAGENTARTQPPTVDDCCEAKASAISGLARHTELRRVLLIVLAINFGMFVAELAAGLAARSSALIADSADMLGDALVYVVSLYALERSARWRAGAALGKGVLIAVFGVGVGVEVVSKLVDDVTPISETMALFGGIALLANVTCLGLLYRFRRRDVNMSSTFECSRNDVIANVGVLLAAAGVKFFENGWPDIAVGSIIALLFGRSAIRVISSAWAELHAPLDSPAS